MKNKSSISEAESYGQIGEFWDAHDLSEVWDETEEVNFEIDLQSENYEKLITMDNADLVSQKQRKRYEILLSLWRASNGTAHRNINFLEICSNLGIDDFEEAQEYLNYFAAEGLINNNAGFEIGLSHKGIVEIENSIYHPQKSTEHFPSTIIQNFNAPVGSVQTGPHNTSNVNQNFENNVSEVLKLLNELKNSLKDLPIEQRQEATELTDFIEGEIVSESPNKTKLKAFLKQLGTFTVDTASNIAATAIAKYYGIDS